MSENEMEYRGSKSVYYIYTVKEQRVDGSWYLLGSKYLRYTLMGCESSYQAGIPSKQLVYEKIGTRTYSTISNMNSHLPQALNTASRNTGAIKLDPYFVTGFTCSASRR